MNYVTEDICVGECFEYHGIGFVVQAIYPISGVMMCSDIHEDRYALRYADIIGTGIMTHLNRPTASTENPGEAE